MSSGQTIPEAPRTPTDAEVIKAGMDRRLRDVHVALAGRVESYDSDKQRADIQPLIQELLPLRDGGEKLETIPEIPNVPIIFPRAGGFFITFPIQKGDFVQLIVNERSLDRWLASQDGRITNPDDFRTHNLSDAVAIPGLYPFDLSITEGGISDNMVMGQEGGSTIHIKPNGEIHAGSENATDFVGLAQKMLDELNQVKADLNAQKATSETHTHGVLVATPGTPVLSSPPSTLPIGLPPILWPTPHTPASVAASKLKAD